MQKKTNENTSIKCISAKINPVNQKTKKMIIERINKPTEKGLYIFECLDSLAMMHYFQYNPIDEATEQTRIKEQICEDSASAYFAMIGMFRSEKEAGFPGYDVKKSPFRVRDLHLESY